MIFTRLKIISFAVLTAASNVVSQVAGNSTSQDNQIEQNNNDNNSFPIYILPIAIIGSYPLGYLIGKCYTYLYNRGHRNADPIVPPPQNPVIQPQPVIFSQMASTHTTPESTKSNNESNPTQISVIPTIKDFAPTVLKNRTF